MFLSGGLGGLEGYFHLSLPALSSPQFSFFNGVCHFTLNSCLLQIHTTQSQLLTKLGFVFRNKACFSTSARTRLVAATCLPLLDYGDVVHMNASAHSLHLLDAVYLSV